MKFKKQIENRVHMAWERGRDRSGREDRVKAKLEFLLSYLIG